VSAALLVVAAALAGCGGAIQSGGESTVVRSDGYRDIELYEGRIDRDESAMQSTASCPGACRAAASICDSAEHICAIARDLSEPDALARCSRARQSCRQAKEHVARSCSCDVESDAGKCATSSASEETL